MSVVETQEVSMDQYQLMASERNTLRLRLKETHADREAQNQEINAAEMRRSAQAQEVRVIAVMAWYMFVIISV